MCITGITDLLTYNLSSKHFCTNPDGEQKSLSISDLLGFLFLTHYSGFRGGLWKRRPFFCWQTWHVWRTRRPSWGVRDSLRLPWQPNKWRRVLPLAADMRTGHVLAICSPSLFFLSRLSLYVSFSALHLLLSFAFGLREKRQACLEGKFLFLFHAVKLLILVIGDKTS